MNIPSLPLVCHFGGSRRKVSRPVAKIPPAPADTFGADAANTVDGGSRPKHGGGRRGTPRGPDARIPGGPDGGVRAPLRGPGAGPGPPPRGGVLRRGRAGSRAGDVPRDASLAAHVPAAAAGAAVGLRHREERAAAPPARGVAAGPAPRPRGG